jgi:hypothetical protein
LVNTSFKIAVRTGFETGLVKGPLNLPAMLVDRRSTIPASSVVDVSSIAGNVDDAGNDVIAIY